MTAAQASLYCERRIIIVSAQQQVAANAALSEGIPSAGSRTFTVPLVPEDGPADASPTHYVCDWAMTTEELSAVAQILAENADQSAFYDAAGQSETNRLTFVLQSAGLKLHVPPSV
jgi:hypothetical protein